jgi:hypothetical protein
MSEILTLQIAVIAACTTVVVAGVHYLMKYLELRRRPLPHAAEIAGLYEHLARIEQTVEVTAVEIERIAEANRFMAKLLAERGSVSVPVSRPERVITPH